MSARVSLKANKQGYFVEIKDEITHATTAYGPYEGPLSYADALLIVGAQLRLEQ